jgi:hypothetical protein
LSEIFSFLAIFFFGSAEGNFVTHERDKVPLLETMCIVLRIMSSRKNLSEHRIVFRSVSALSRIFNGFCCYALSSVRLLLGSVNINTIPWEAWQDAFDEITQLPGSQIAYLLDGKLWETTELDALPGALYSGEKKRDGIKTLNMVGPDGMCFLVAGPFVGSMHDARCYRNAGWHMATLRINQAKGVRGYADSAFPKSEGLWTNFKRPQMDAQMRSNQARLQEARGEVEHFFCTAMQLWKFVCVRDHQTFGRRPVFAYILLAIFLTNCANAASGGNQIAAKFQLQPPSFREYLTQSRDVIDSRLH